MNMPPAAWGLARVGMLAYAARSVARCAEMSATRDFGARLTVRTGFYLKSIYVAIADATERGAGAVAPFRQNDGAQR